MSPIITSDRLIIIDKELSENCKFINTLKEHFNIAIEIQTNLNDIDENDENVLYISSTFEGCIFEKLLYLQKPIISDIIVYHCIQNRSILPLPKYPLFNYFMKDFVICFSIEDKKQTHLINKYLNLIRFMSGKSRRDMKSGKSFERTHLIESKTDSVNYKLASIYGIPILYKEWIDYFWSNRRNENFNPKDEKNLIEFRIKPLADLHIALYGYTPEEIEEKTKLIIKYGGNFVSLYDSKTTHLVVKDENDQTYIDILDNFKTIPKFVVTEQWLATSIRLNYREQEDNFLLKIPLNDDKSDCESTPMKDSTLNSILLSPNYDNSINDDSSIADKNDLKKQAITQELYQTELNYVQILKDIIKIFRDPLKNHQLPGEFPNEIELKAMFGGLPPIIDVHEQILNELEPVVKNWKAENEIGKIFQKHSQDFLTVYPQYVNFYEKTKETIEQCINKYPKFHSFLKAGQAASECRKQTLQELLINPIQRLPRIELYIRTLLERTDKRHPDYKLLNEALNTIVSVNKVINLEKKKTEGQMELFELLNDIEDCPATLLSANRHFISKCDAKLLIQNTTTENEVTIHRLDDAIFTLLLFTDWILLCKKRIVKRTNSLKDQRKTPNIPINVSKKSKKTTYRYIETIELTTLKHIIDEFEDKDTLPDSNDAFALITFHSTNRYFPIYPFVIKDLEIKKEKFIEDIIDAFVKLNQMDEILDSFIKKGNMKTLDFSHSKIIARSLKKTKYNLMRTKERLNRTFSMRRHTTNLFSASMENLTSVIPVTSSPSSRLSRVFTNLNFFTPKGNDLFNNDQVNSFNDISELDNSDASNDNISLPATPAPKKKLLYHGAV